MKKGCFIKIVVSSTIIIGAVLYILQHKFDEFIAEPGKRIIQEIIKNRWDSELKYVKNTEEKDSLRNLLIYYVNSRESTEEFVNDKQLEALMESLNIILEDSLIDIIELENLTKLVKR